MFERIFGRKPPKKENPMDQFKTKTHEHGQFTVLFGGSYPQIESQYKRLIPDVKCTVVKDKEESRIQDMLELAGTSGHEVIELQLSAVTAVMVADTPEKTLLMQVGAIKCHPQGVTLCPGCLQQTIFKCEEQLQALRDLQEATKDYCK